MDIEPDKIQKGKEITEEIIRSAEISEKLIFEKGKRKRYSKLLSELETRFSKLSRDVQNREKSSLSSDWQQLGEQNMSKLKDDVLALREFLKKNEAALKKRWNEMAYGADIEDLVRNLKNEESVDSLTVSKLSNAIKNRGEDEIESITKENTDRLNRITRWLLLLREVRNAE